MIPNYEVSETKIGKSSSISKVWKYPRFHISDGSFIVSQQGVNGRFNPFRISMGGTTLGIGRHNVWFPDDGFIGFFLKRIFK